MAAAPAVGKPIGVELRRQIIDKEFEIVGFGLDESFRDKGVGIRDIMMMMDQTQIGIMG